MCQKDDHQDPEVCEESKLFQLEKEQDFVHAKNDGVTRIYHHRHSDNKRESSWSTARPCRLYHAFMPAVNTFMQAASSLRPPRGEVYDLQYALY